MKRLLYFFCVLSACFAAMPLLGQSIPEIPYDSTPNLLKMPNDIYLGEVLGVSTSSKGHIFVYTRTGSVNLTTGTNRVSRLTPCAWILRIISGSWTKAPT